MSYGLNDRCWTTLNFLDVIKVLWLCGRKFQKIHAVFRGEVMVVQLVFKQTSKVCICIAEHILQNEHLLNVHKGIQMVIVSACVAQTFFKELMGRGLLGVLLTKSCWASEVRIHQQKTKPKLGEAPLRWFLLTVEFTKKVLKLVVYRLFGLQFEDFCCTENH